MLRLSTEIILACICLILYQSREGLGQRRIIQGGIVENPADYNFVVAIEKTGEHICGGAVINSKYVLTSASCFASNIFEKQPWLMYFVSVGSSSTSAGFTNAILRIIKHEDYDQKYMHHNVALVKTNDEMIFSRTIQPIKFFTAKKFNGKKYVLVSYESTGHTGQTTSYTLKSIWLHPLSHDDCLMLYPEGDMICTKAEKNRGPCRKDDGSPLVTPWKKKELVAIASNPDCSKTRANVFTSVAYYSGWIQDNAV